jgi:hypothetical protein
MSKRSRGLESDALSQPTVGFILRHDSCATLAFEFADERAFRSRTSNSTIG